MCGISAIISGEGFDLLELRGMTNVISHRGPDDEGFACFSNNGHEYVCAGKDTPKQVYNEKLSYLPTDEQRDNEGDFNVGIGHRRLSIIDLSPRGHQPMCDSTERYWVVYNGEIFNYLEIKQELAETGVVFISDSDTEVILESYKKWGVECQQRFNGMWAFLIYDKDEQSIFVSRDRYGIKPLYYWQSGNGNYYFASEIKQFTVCNEWEASLNHENAYDYLHFALTDHNSATMFRGVHKLLPGHYFFNTVTEIISNSKLENKQIKWLNSSEQNFNGSFSEACDEFRSRFFSAVNLHMRSDVEVGSALSGGLDSSAIVSCINIILNQQGKASNQKTFSSCSEDRNYDEREWMEEVVSQTGVDAHFIYPKGMDIFSLTDKIIWFMDEPYQSQSAFLGYHVFKKAKENGVIVLLNGQGADEYLSGYTEYCSLRLFNLLLKGELLSFIKERKGLSLGSTFKFIISSILVRSNIFGHKIFNKFRKGGSDLKEIINYDKLNSHGSHLYSLLNYRKSSVKEISTHQLMVEPLQKYLRWEDRNSMAHSVEARVPFLDCRLVEFTTSLPLDYLDGYNSPKKLLVSSLREILPVKISERKDKKGFITPEKRWFTEDYKKEFIKLFNDNVDFSHGIIKKADTEIYLKKMQEGLIPFDYTYWRIILFCIWMKVFKVKI